MTKIRILGLLVLVTTAVVSVSPSANAGKAGSGACNEAAIAVSYVKNTFGLSNVSATNVTLVTSSPYDPGTNSITSTWAVTVAGSVKHVPETCNIQNTTQQFFDANGMGSGCVVLGVSGSCTAN